MQIEKTPKSQKEGRGYVKNIPIETLLELSRKNLTQEQIATLVGCERSNVSKRLAKYKGQLDGLDRYKRHRADILAIHQQRVLDAITDAKLKSAPLNVLGPAFGILYDKERLERGQSTDNISVKTLMSGLATDLEELRRRKEALEQITGR